MQKKSKFSERKAKALKIKQKFPFGKEKRHRRERIVNKSEKKKSNLMTKHQRKCHELKNNKKFIQPYKTLNMQ